MTLLNRLLLLLACCLLSGCAGGTLPEKAAWPWEYGKDYGGKNQTGDYAWIRGNVATFDAPPQAAKPVGAQAAIAPSPSLSSARPTPPANRAAPAGGSVAGTETLEYDFAVQHVAIEPPPYLPAGSLGTTYDITAFNRGAAPVSVTITFEDISSGNLSLDRSPPYDFVVPPHADRVLLHVGPKLKGEAFRFSHRYSWSIGDYAATHHCPEGYRFPFGKEVTAFASVSHETAPSAYTRHAVIFAIPVGTPIVAARKGVVARTRPGKIDILHDDSTVGTYAHLESITAGIAPGSKVAAGEVIGIVGAAEDNREGYVQLTVWRPEPPGTSMGQGFELVSFPLPFCRFDSGRCAVLDRDQVVSPPKTAVTKKQKK